MDLSQRLLIVFVVFFTALAAVWDWRTNKLPNWLTVTAFVSGIVFHLVAGGFHGGIAGAGSSLLFAMAGCATGFGILFVLWLIGGGGGGDVKLMGALGAWLGPQYTLWVFLLSAVMVLVGSIGILTWQAAKLGVIRTKARYFNRQPVATKGSAVAGRRRRLMPYGIPVALATWCVLAFISLRG